MFMRKTNSGGASNEAAGPSRDTSSSSKAAYGQNATGSHQNTMSRNSNNSRKKRMQNSKWVNASVYGNRDYASNASNAWNQPSSSSTYNLGRDYNAYSHSSDYNRGHLPFDYGMRPSSSAMPMLDDYDLDMASHSLNMGNVRSDLNPSEPYTSSYQSYNQSVSYNDGASYGLPSRLSMEHAPYMSTESEAELAINILNNVLKEKRFDPMYTTNPQFPMAQENYNYQPHKKGNVTTSQRENYNYQPHKKGNVKTSQKKKRKFDTQSFSQDYGDSEPGGLYRTSIKQRLSVPGLHPGEEPFIQQQGYQNKLMSQQGSQLNVYEETGTELFDSSQYTFRCKNIPRNPISLEKKQKEISEKAARGISSRCLKCHICDENNFEEVQDFHEHLHSSSHIRLVKKYLEKLSAAYTLMALDVQMASRRQCIKEVLQKVGKGSQGSQFKNKYNGLSRVMPKCKICQVPKILKHETLREVKILHDFAKPKCLFCDESFTNRLMYEEHMLTVSHLMNVWEQEDDIGEKSEAWSKLKVEYTKRIDSIEALKLGSRHENYDSVVKDTETVDDDKMETEENGKTGQKNTEINIVDFKVKEEIKMEENAEVEEKEPNENNGDMKVKEVKENEVNVADNFVNDDDKVKILKEEGDVEMKENERNEVTGNEEMVGRVKPKDDPENKEENDNQEEEEIKETNSAKLVSSLRICADGGCKKQYTSDDPHAYCIHHDACMQDGAFDPENCSTCILLLTPLKGLPLPQMRKMNEYRRLRTRWNKAKKISQSVKPRWRNLELMQECGFIFKATADKLVSVQENCAAVSYKGPLLSSEKELFVLREQYPNIKTPEEMLLQPYVPDVPFGVNFLINNLEAYCVACHKRVGNDTDAIQKHCKSKEHYQSQKGNGSNGEHPASNEKMENEDQLDNNMEVNNDKESKFEKGDDLIDFDDDYGDIQIIEEDIQMACESEIKEAVPSNEERPEVGEEDVRDEEDDDDFGNLKYDEEEDGNEFEVTGGENEEIDEALDSEKLDFTDI